MTGPEQIDIEVEDILAEEYIAQLLAKYEAGHEPSMDERKAVVDNLEKIIDNEKKGPLVKEKFRLVRDNIHEAGEYKSQLGVLLR